MLLPRLGRREPPGRAQHGLNRWVLAEFGIEQADEVPIGLADRTRVAGQIKKNDRVDVAEGFPERDVPVDLIGERVPGEADDWHAALADKLHVMPLSPQPTRRFA